MHARKKLTQLLEVSVHDTPCEKCGKKAISRIRSRFEDPSHLSHRESDLVCMVCGHVQPYDSTNFMFGNDFPYARS
jgi:hypothetical protein